MAGAATWASKAAGYGHLSCTLPTGADIDERLPWLHIVLSNFKRWTLDIFHEVSPKHLQAYLDELCYRLNRREKGEDIFRRPLNRRVLYGTPATSSLLTGAWVKGMAMSHQTPAAWRLDG